MAHTMPVTKKEREEREDPRVNVDAVEFRRSVTPVFGPFGSTGSWGFSAFLTRLPYLLGHKPEEEQSLQPAE